MQLVTFYTRTSKYLTVRASSAPTSLHEYSPFKFSTFSSISYSQAFDQTTKKHIKCSHHTLVAKSHQFVFTSTQLFSFISTCAYVRIFAVHPCVPNRRSVLSKLSVSIVHCTRSRSAHPCRVY